MSRIQIPFTILFFIVSVLFFAPEQTATAQNVNIPDANLCRLLQSKFGTLITQADMSRLGWLKAGFARIRNLTGLEFATNLTWLALSKNPISDFRSYLRV